MLVSGIVNKPFKCIVLLYSTPGLPDATEVKNHARNVGVVCEKDNTTHVLMNMLEKCIPWTQPLVFCGVDPQCVTPLVERFMRTKRNGKYYRSTYDQLEIDRKTLDKTVTNLPPIPAGNVFSQFLILNFKELLCQAMIFDHWHWRMLRLSSMLGMTRPSIITLSLKCDFA